MAMLPKRVWKFLRDCKDWALSCKHTRGFQKRQKSEDVKTYPAWRHRFGHMVVFSKFTSAFGYWASVFKDTRGFENNNKKRLDFLTYSGRQYLAFTCDLLSVSSKDQHVMRKPRIAYLCKFGNRLFRYRNSLRFFKIEVRAFHMRLFQCCLIWEGTRKP